MAEQSDNRRVVVGIDGSKSAVRAALWAADEAASIDSSLLLLYAVQNTGEDQEVTMADARRAVSAAWEAVLAAGKTVKVESDIVYGDPVRRLVEASENAQMVCVGHKGTHDSERGHRGATATAVAENASCTAVVVRHRRTPYRYEWVVVPLDESPHSHVVLQMATNEAMLRKAALLALTSWPTTRSRRLDRHSDDLRAKLDRYLDHTRHSDTDLKVCALPMPDHIFNVLEESANIDQLVVVDGENPDLVRDVLSRQASRILRKSNCSIMIVRGQPLPAD